MRATWAVDDVCSMGGGTPANRRSRDSRVGPGLDFEVQDVKLRSGSGAGQQETTLAAEPPQVDPSAVLTPAPSPAGIDGSEPRIWRRASATNSFPCWLAFLGFPPGTHLNWTGVWSTPSAALAS